MPCPPPKRSNKIVLMGGAAVVIAAAVTGYFLMGSPEKKTVQPDSQKEVPEVTVNTDTLKKDTEDIQMETPQKAQPEKPKPVLNGRFRLRHLYRRFEERQTSWTWDYKIYSKP